MNSASWFGLAVIVGYLLFIGWVLFKSAKSRPVEKLTPPQGERKPETMPAWELPPSLLSSTGKVDADGRPAGVRPECSCIETKHGIHIDSCCPVHSRLNIVRPRSNTE